MLKRLGYLTFVAGVLFVMKMPILGASEFNSPEGPEDGQRTKASAPPTAPVAEEDAPPKRLFGIVPNYRTTQGQTEYIPLTSGEKFRIATKDSFDRGTLILSGLFAGESQLTKSTPSFGQGPSGFARYYAASYGDFAIGNFMTEAVYPSIFHEDPRYFRRGTDSTLSRLGYAVQQIFWTRTDSGRRQFNFPEILGNSSSVAISNAYYPDSRTAANAATRLSVQIGVDIAGNILKEFSPELNRLLSRKHSEKKP
jgi:hypothetical protein